MKHLPHAAANLCALAIALLASGCATPPAGPAPITSNDGAAPAATGPVALARLVTAAGQSAGQVTLTTVAGGVDVSVAATGLAPGVHGVHFHANGACAPGPDADAGRIVDFGAAGGHFDPGATRNHGAPGESMHVAHAGELPNLTAGADGRGSLRYLNANVTVAPGAQSVLGRTLVVHANADDYATDPSGNSGARVLCGLIEPAAPGVVTARTTFEGAQVYPEGITIDAASGDAYVGSTSNGDLFRITKGAAKAELLQSGGAPGRQGAFGMKLDDAKRLWIAGGPNGTLAVVDPRSAATLAVFTAPKGGQSFVNDVAFGRDGSVYATDSFQPVIYRARYQPGAAPSTLEPWLDLSNTPLRYVPNQINLNGIVASADGRVLLSIQLSTGQLWRIDTQTRTVTEVRIEGGTLKDGDGLTLLDANELVVMRNAPNELVRVRMDAGWASGRIEQRITDARLRYPTTAAVSGRNELMVVNAQLDRQKSPPPVLPFDVVVVDFRRPQ